MHTINFIHSEIPTQIVSVYLYNLSNNRVNKKKKIMLYIIFEVSLHDECHELYIQANYEASPLYRKKSMQSYYHFLL